MMRKMSKRIWWSRAERIALIFVQVGLTMWSVITELWITSGFCFLMLAFQVWFEAGLWDLERMFLDLFETEDGR